MQIFVVVVLIIVHACHELGCQDQFMSIIKSLTVLW